MLVATIKGGQTMSPLGIVELLELRGFDPKRPAKLVRHKDTRYDVHDLMRRGWLDAYQASQSRPVFDGCERIVVIHWNRRNESTPHRCVSSSTLDVTTDAKCLCLRDVRLNWGKVAISTSCSRSPVKILENRVVIEWERLLLPGFKSSPTRK